VPLAELCAEEEGLPIWGHSQQKANIHIAESIVLPGLPTRAPFMSISIGVRKFETNPHENILSPFLPYPFYVIFAIMGSKDKGKKEVKKAPKPKPKPEPGRKREGFAPAPAK
jgi:hypothetical protein